MMVPWDVFLTEMKDKFSLDVASDTTFRLRGPNCLARGGVCYDGAEDFDVFDREMLYPENPPCYYRMTKIRHVA